jgi:hypothetical protein
MRVTKRQKISASALLLATGLFLLPTLDPNTRIYLLISIVLGSYLLSVWSIYDRFSLFEYLSLFVLPVFLTVSFALYLTQFATDLVGRVLLAAVYVAVMYTILLAENIFNVSAERNIPLVRAARTVGYISTLFVSFAFYTLLAGLKPQNFVFAISSLPIAFLIIAQGLWQIDLKATNLPRLFFLAGLAAIVLGQVALAFSFWPLEPPKMGLVLTAATYVLLGIFQHHILQDLTKRTVVEYIIFSGALGVLLLISTSWGV